MPDTAGGETVRRSTAFALLAEAVRTVATATLTFYLVRMLSPQGYGVYALALSVGMLAMPLSDFGTSAATSRFVAERRRESAAVAGVVRDALRLKLALAAAMATALALLAAPIADAYGEQDLVWPIRAMALVVFLQSLFQLAVGVFIGLARNALQARLYTVQGLTETTSAIVIVAIGAGAGGALLGRALGYGAALAVGLVSAVAVLGSGLVPRRHGEGFVRQIARYAGALFVIDAAFLLFTQIDVLLLAAYRGTEAAGLFQAPTRLLLFVLLAGQAVSNAVAPRVARSDSEPADVASLVTALRLLTVLSAGAVGVLMAWADPIVRVAFGEAYDQSADVLRALGPFLLLGVLGPLVTVSVNYLGQAGRRVPIVVGIVVLQVVLDLLLIPVFGLVGPAIATDVTYGVYLPFHLWLLHRALGLPLRSLGLTFVRAAAAGLALAGVLVLVGTEADLSATKWLIGLPVGVTVFAGVLVAVGELRAADAAIALRRLRPGRRR